MSGYFLSYAQSQKRVGTPGNVREILVKLHEMVLPLPTNNVVKKRAMRVLF